jgi:transposase
MSSLLGIVGIERDDLLKEYTKILKQDKDLSTKLKSMLPLLKELGLTWEQEQTNVKVPILNITTRGIDNSIDSSTKPLDTQ